MTTYQPIPQPKFGLCLPVRYAGNHDGDTISVVLPSGRICKVRLDNVRAPELADVGGDEVRKRVAKLCNGAEEMALYVPLPSDRNRDGRLDIPELIGSLTFDRIVGRIFLDGIDLGGYLIEHGLCEPGKKMGTG